MGLLKPILGGGFPYLWPLRGNRDFFDIGDITTREQIDLQFFSDTGDYIGSIGTGHDGAPSLKLKLLDKKIGGLGKFSFTIPRDIDFPFFNLMSVNILINQIHWFTGELQFLPDQDRRDVSFQYMGNGYVTYMKKVKINQVYSNQKLLSIIIDLIETRLSDVPVNYNPDKINVPDITLVKLEANDETVFKTMESILGHANQDINTTEYRFGIDKDKDFFFLPMSNDHTYNFFEGHDYQNPSVTKNSDKLKNKIKIYRSIEDSDQTEFVSTIEDTESQARYGVADSELLLSNFYDTTTAEKIAEAKLEYYKEPRKKIEIEDLKIDTNPYPFEKYYISNSRREYSYLISEFENTNDWTVALTNTTLTVTDEKVLTGKKTFKLETAVSSEGEYIEIELEDIIYFPSELIFYISQNTRGQTVNITIFDSDGNSVEIEQVVLELNSGKLLQSNNGKLLQLNSSASGIDIKLLEEFQKQIIDISSVSNVEKIRFTMVTNEDITFYLDRLEVKANQYFTNKIFPQEFEYEIDRGTILSNATFGDEKINIINEIEELSEKEKNITNIFQKGS